MSHRLAAACVAAAAFAAFGAPTPAVAAPAPFGHSCTPQGPARFCPAADLAQRAPSWDGTPIDVDVTLPATGDGPFPTILLLHGVGGTKTMFEATDPAANAGYNNLALAARGYAVVTPTARGYGGSCGKPESRTPDCAAGYTYLGDERYEVRDGQALLGELVDEGVAMPNRIGVTGVSYGGGFSTMSAYLRDRVRLPDGRYAPWVSPKGTPLRFAAAYARWPWSSGAAIFARNGRDIWSQTPVGVVAGSYLGAIFGVPKALAWVAPQGTPNYAADLLTWEAASEEGRDTPAVRKALQNAFDYHGVAGTTGTPAPILLESGWTDNLFPVAQSLAVYDRVRKADPKAPVQLQVGDIGHARGTNHPEDVRRTVAGGLAWLDYYLLNKGPAPQAGKVTAFLQTCPKTTPSSGEPVVAGSFAALARGSFTLSGAATKTQTVTSTGGDVALGEAVDPLGKVGGDACATYDTVTSPNTAVLTRRSPGLTLLGLPVVRAKVVTKGANGQLIGRLWDVDPATGKQRLIMPGAYRLTPNQRGTIAWKLDGNGYRFAAGHTIRLEIVGRSAPTYANAPNAFSAKLSGLSVTLPTRDAPSRAKGIAAP